MNIFCSFFCLENGWGLEWEEGELWVWGVWRMKRVGFGFGVWGVWRMKRVASGFGVWT